MIQLTQDPDMPGDKVQIQDIHLQKARTIFDKLKLEKGKKSVVSIYGPSGVGKSEIALVLAALLSDAGIKTYVISGDNYPHRIPKYNDAERLAIFRTAGTKAIIGVDCKEDLKRLQEEGNDSNAALIKEYNWLSAYQKAGKRALQSYLGTRKEQDYDYLNSILASFKNGSSTVYLKHMGRSETDLSFDRFDILNLDVLIVEWTHGNSRSLKKIDYPIFLYSSPEETLEHRLQRRRDGKPDSPFTTLVLGIEQDLLMNQVGRAFLVLDKNGAIR